MALLERSLSKARGSSKGSARIFAPAAYPDEEYLALALRALARWREIETETGRRLLWATGAVTHGKFAERQMDVLREAGVEVGFLSTGDAARRFGLRAPAGGPLLYQPDAGIIRADHARAALLGLARTAGAELCDGEGVRSLTDGDDAAVVETDRRRWSCSAAIVAAGPWSGALLAAAGIEVPLSVSLQSVAYFDLLDRSGPPVALIEFEGDEPYACWDPERGLKAALHARGPVTDPESAGHEIEQRAIDRITEWVHARYSGIVAAAGAREVETCMYTNAPEERFVFDRRGRIVVGSACNGQGFQFAPETGERLARLALETAPLSAIMAGRG